MASRCEVSRVIWKVLCAVMKPCDIARPIPLAGDASLRERFLRETRTAASFSHPNSVPVHAVEDRDGVLAFAMGFVEGESVAERVRRAGPRMIS